MKPDGLVEWLRAQIDEDERIARDRWRGKPGRPRHKMTSLGDFVEVEVDGFPAQPMTWEEYRDEFMVLGKPDRRLLAEVAAKRAILAELDTMPHALDDGHHECPMVEPGMWRDPRCTCGTDPFVDRMRRHLATAFADREGWREEWRP